MSSTNSAFCFVPDREYPAHNGLFMLLEYDLAHNGPYPVINPESSLIPRIEAQEDCVLREELDRFS